MPAEFGDLFTTVFALRPSAWGNSEKGGIHIGERPSRRPNCCYSCCYFFGKTCVNHCRYKVGAGEGNRTLISGLGSPHSTTEPHQLPVEILCSRPRPRAQALIWYLRGQSV